METTNVKLTLETLRSSAAGGAVAIRAIVPLAPAGGESDKVFPPTYASDNAATKYALEQRVGGGATVLLDSVQSQANRIEAALQDAIDDDGAPIPVVVVDFGNGERVTSLTAPHRVADAILRDSNDADGVAWRDTAAGRAIFAATSRDATGMYRHCPTALVFGAWDSTGPAGGGGHKFARCLTSEIVGHGAVLGCKTASRIDPLGIERVATIYQSAANPTEWVSDAEDAAKGAKGEPLTFGDGRPSTINHGNIAPGVDTTAGGVTITGATQTVVLSLAGLRRVRFAGTSRDAQIDGRTALAALALYGVTLARAGGYDLRSRCLLVPTGPLMLEVIGPDGGEPTRVALSVEHARELLDAAVAAATASGLGWQVEPITLRPQARVVRMVEISRRLAAAGIA